MLTDRFIDAVGYAVDVHAADTRKGGDIPYVGHLLAVSALVIDHAGTEDQAIAALLHDTAEDHGGAARLREITGRFGADVASIVEHCSDSLEPEDAPKERWWPRKVRYIERFDVEAEAGPALLVATADKLYNVRSLLADYRVKGEDVWSVFNADSGRAGQRWYYTRMAQIAERQLADTPQQSLADELARTVETLRDVIVAAGATDLDTLERELAEACAEERTIRRTGG